MSIIKHTEPVYEYKGKAYKTLKEAEQAKQEFKNADIKHDINYACFDHDSFINLEDLLKLEKICR